MPPSEIDLIFSSKAKRPVPSTSSSAPSSAPAAPPPSLPAHKQKKKKDKKRKRDDAADVNPDAPAPASSSSSVPKPNKRPAVETILDPSARLSTLPAPAAKRPKASSKPTPAAPPSKPSSKALKDDDARFKDSRGTGPRRKTEEGFAIYKEDELGIQDAGGDTPLCPFDCDCCF